MVTESAGLPSFCSLIDWTNNSDVEVLVAGQLKPAHLCILASKSDVILPMNVTAATFESIYDLRSSNNNEIYSTRQSRAARLSLLASGKYADVTLVLEDGELKAHRMLLASGSELMKAMLIGSWRESSSDQIKMTDIYYDHMVECCRWIYARALPDWSCPTKKLIEMIPIVSRMCLTDYFGSLESIIIDRLKNATLHVGLRFAIQALEICEAHHADRLANWIIRHLSVNFADIVSLHKSYFLELSPSKQKEIETNQWPPIYYQKEKALYEKTLRQRALKEKSKHSRVP